MLRSVKKRTVINSFTVIITGYCPWLVRSQVTYRLLL